MSEERTPPSTAEKDRVQRISFQGMAATTSTLAALVVALASAFTAVRAFTLTETAAQQRVFERQLDACLELNTLVSQVSANNRALLAVLEWDDATVVPNRAAPAGATGGAATYTALEDAHVRLNTLEAQMPLLDRETMRLAMIMPESDAAMQLRAAHGQQESLLNAVLEAERPDQVGFMSASEAKIVRLTGVANGGVQHMEAATTACQAHVSGVVRRGTLS